MRVSNYERGAGIVGEEERGDGGGWGVGAGAGSEVVAVGWENLTLFKMKFFKNLKP